MNATGVALWMNEANIGKVLGIYFGRMIILKISIVNISLLIEQ